MSYWRAYYHLIWTTKNREPFIVGPRKQLLAQAIHVKSRDQNAYVHAIGLMPEHIHIAVSIPPIISVTHFVKLIKGSTSHYLNHTEPSTQLGWFGWQSEFGMLTFGERSLPSIITYLNNQAEHHAANNLWPTFEGPVAQPSAESPVETGG